jgi:hypothetical protein
MEPKYIERLVGKYCKIVIKEPGEKKGTVRIGLIENINYLDNSITIEVKEGENIVCVDNIIAIRSVQ